MKKRLRPTDLAKGFGPRTPQRIRERQRIEIEADLLAFLEDGGEIEQLTSIQLRASNTARGSGKKY